MKKLFKSIIATILVVSMLCVTSVVAFASSNIQEEYICDIRLIYTDTYEEAKLVLTESKLEGYKILNNNLNANSGKQGVWLAYKVTTNIPHKASPSQNYQSIHNVNTVVQHPDKAV